MAELLEIRDLSVEIMSTRGLVHAVRGVNLTVEAGSIHGIVGESGCGKSVTSRSILRLYDKRYVRTRGQILFDGQDLLECSEKQMQKIRGKQISMIFQDPMTALNPLYKVGDQIAEVYTRHFGDSRKEARKKALEMLELVGIPGDRSGDYPHQFSGGMKQRVVIAMALACSPELILADEPTTALDVTIQAQILDMIKALKEKQNTSMILITHDLGVVAEVCDRVAVVYAGEIIEYGTKEEIFDYPTHPYTVGLFGSIPKIHEDVEWLDSIPGMPPNPADLPSGCHFHPRCSKCTQPCGEKAPEMVEIRPGHFVRCLNCTEKKES